MKHLHAKRIKSYKKRKNIIHITESLDNNHEYKLVTLVSLFSILLNCNKKKTLVIFHVLVTLDFNDSSVTIFKSSFKKFSHNVEIIIYNKGNHFLNRIKKDIHKLHFIEYLLQYSLIQKESYI